MFGPVPNSFARIVYTPLAPAASAPIRELEHTAGATQPRTKHRVRILSMGNDPALLDSRQLVLQSAGHDVISASDSSAITQDALQAFDVIVICHTVGRRDQIVQMIRVARPNLPILLLGEICSDSLSSGAIYISPTPEELLKAIEEVVNASAVNN